jgi:actin-like protein 6A
MSYGTTHGDEQCSAVVLDIGSNTTKAGFAGEDSPQHVFSSAVGTWMDDGAGGDGGKSYAVNRREVWHSRHREQLPFELEFPVVQGQVRDWDCLERVWEHVLRNQLGVSEGEADRHPILMVESNFASRRQREGMTERLFETFGAPAVHLAKSALCSCVAASKSTGLVLEAGGGISTCTPVLDGTVMQQGIVKSALAGDFLTDQLVRQIQLKQPVLPAHSFRASKRDARGVLKVEPLTSAQSPAAYSSYMQRMTFQGIKETLCQMSERQITQDTHIPGLSARLPDGKEVELQRERFIVPELLLTGVSDKRLMDTVATPENHCHDLVSLFDLLTASVAKIEGEDEQRKFYMNVVVCGGSSLFPKMDNRVRAFIETKWNLPPGKRIISSPSAPMQPTYYQKWSAWLGGSIMSSFSSFMPMWASKQEYDEHGVNFVLKRSE